jgi:hypothetical protein
MQTVLHTRVVRLFDLLKKKITEGSGSLKKFRIKEPRVPVFQKQKPRSENRRLLMFQRHQKNQQRIVGWLERRVI